MEPVAALTHNERVLALLSDGKPHSHHELYGLFVIAHSRISDLRKRGHTIEMWREGDSYFYRLQSSAPDLPQDPAATESSRGSGADTHSAAGRRPPLLGGSSSEIQVDRVDEGPQSLSTPAAVQLALEYADFYVRNYGEPRAA